VDEKVKEKKEASCKLLTMTVSKNHIFRSGSLNPSVIKNRYIFSDGLLNKNAPKMYF